LCFVTLPDRSRQRRQRPQQQRRPRRRRQQRQPRGQRGRRQERLRVASRGSIIGNWCAGGLSTLNAKPLFFELPGGQSAGQALLRRPLQRAHHLQQLLSVQPVQLKRRASLASHNTRNKPNNNARPAASSWRVLAEINEGTASTRRLCSPWGSPATASESRETQSAASDRGPGVSFGRGQQQLWQQQHQCPGPPGHPSWRAQPPGAAAQDDRPAGTPLLLSWVVGARHTAADACVLMPSSRRPLFLCCRPGPPCCSSWTGT
jgi:hypothetical protein